MTSTPTGTTMHPEAPARLAALREHLGARGFALEPDGTGLTVIAPVDDRGFRLAVRVVCKPRPSDSGRLWFWTEEGEPIAEADRIVDAAVLPARRPTQLTASDACAGCPGSWAHFPQQETAACCSTREEPC